MHSILHCILAWEAGVRRCSCSSDTPVCEQVLQKVRGTDEVEVELTQMRRAVSKAEASKASMVLFRRRRHLPQLLWCIAMPVMQQYTGMNAFMFYGGCPAVPI